MYSDICHSNIIIILLTSEGTGGIRNQDMI